MFDEDISHSMTYAERESLKVFAQKGKNLDTALILVTYWLRCAQDITFDGFVSNWAEANRSDDIEAIRTHWPHSGPRMIADGSTEWGSTIPEA